MYALDTCLWVVASLLCGAALFVELSRKRANRLPAFSFYLGFSALTNPIGFAIRSARIFEWFMFSVSVAGFILELAVIYELANKIFLTHASLAKIFRAAPRWCTATLFLLVTLAGALLPQHARSLAMQAYSTLSFSLNLMDFGLLLTLLLVSRVLGLSWGTLPAGAALGIGIIDAGCAAGAVLLGQFGPRYFVDFVRLGSFDMAGLVFLFSVCVAEKVAGTSEQTLQVSHLSIRSHEAEEVALIVKRGQRAPN